MKVTAEAARRFLVARHLLAPARSVAGGLDGVVEVLRRLGSIQFDPVAVAGRNHDLVLHARVAGYEPEWCDELYERREIFETTNKALSFIPMSEVPWFRSSSGRKGRRFHAAALAENAAVAERVLERIRAEGPLSSRDFEREAGPTKDWFGMPENAVRAVLEAYTVAGVLGLARRDGNVRYYDLIERLVPAEVLAQEVPVRDQLRHKLLSRYRAHGLLGPGGAGGTFARIAEPSERKELLQGAGRDLARSCPSMWRVVRGKRFVLAEELALLESPTRVDTLGRVHRPVRLAALGHRPAREPVRLRIRVGGLLLRRQSAVGATTCSRSSSATASSVGSNRGSIETEHVSRSSRSGGRTTSSPSAPTVSSTR